MVGKQAEHYPKSTNEGSMEETTKRTGVSPISGVAPPKDRQFGAKNGNPRNPSGWKKSDTLRYKWEQMLKLDDDELQAVLDDPKATRVEHMTAEILLDKTMKPAEKMSILATLSNQIYGMPKQVNENKNIEIKPILPMKGKK